MEINLPGTITGSQTNILPNQPYQPVYPLVDTYSHYVLTTSLVNTADYEIRSLEKGYILKHQGKEYAFETEASLLAFLKPLLKKK